MENLDFKKTLKDLYLPKTGEPVSVVVPKMSFLMVDGHGDPNTSQEYIDAIEALYPMAYTLKFMAKSELQKNFPVMPLEGLWWTENMNDFSVNDKSNWLWTAMIMQPDFITNAMFDRAVKLVAEKKNPKLLGKVRLETYEEGRSAQVMYVGPYSEEGPTIMKVHEFIKQNGGKLDETNKHHHEIYLGDPRRTAPSKLKTVIRQPY
jgi:hypothetical protein